MSAQLQFPGMSPSRDESDFAKAAFLVQLVALASGLSASDIATRRRETAVTRARHTAMYLAHTVLQWPLARVADAFGRDRSTVGHACGQIEDGREDARFDAGLCAVEAMLLAAPEGLLS